MISNRIRRERKTFKMMLEIYCSELHGPKATFCKDCEELLEYAMRRLEKCPFQEGKTTCAKCPIHCYQREQREKTRAVMRYAGPRMLFKHPYLAVAHLLDGFRSSPVRPSNKEDTQFQD